MGAPYIYDISRVRVKNSGCATPDLVMSYLSSSRRQTYVRKVNPAMYIVNESG